MSDDAAVEHEAGAGMGAGEGGDGAAQLASAEQIMYFGEAQLADVFFVLLKQHGHLTRMDMSMSRDSLATILRTELGIKDDNQMLTLTPGQHGWKIYKTADLGLPVPVMFAGGQYEAAYFNPGNAYMLLTANSSEHEHART